MGNAFQDSLKGELCQERGMAIVLTLRDTTVESLEEVIQGVFDTVEHFEPLADKLEAEGLGKVAGAGQPAVIARMPNGGMIAASRAAIDFAATHGGERIRITELAGHTPRQIAEAISNHLLGGLSVTKPTGRKKRKAAA